MINLIKSHLGKYEISGYLNRENNKTDIKGIGNIELTENFIIIYSETQQTSATQTNHISGKTFLFPNSTVHIFNNLNTNYCGTYKICDKKISLNTQGYSQFWDENIVLLVSIEFNNNEIVVKFYKKNILYGVEQWKKI